MAIQLLFGERWEVQTTLHPLSVTGLTQPVVCMWDDTHYEKGTSTNLVCVYFRSTMRQSVLIFYFAFQDENESMCYLRILCVYCMFVKCIVFLYIFGTYVLHFTTFPRSWYRTRTLTQRYRDTWRCKKYIYIGPK